MNEFDLIARYFHRPGTVADLGVGDDAALLTPAPGQQLAISVDMLVAGRHFFEDVDPFTLGHKSLAVNLSDLAAMGATPRWFTLALALPHADAAWLEAFSRGMFALAEAHGLELVGGDTTRGPLTISIQIAGEVPKGSALLRGGAQADDDIWVSGQLGAAAAAVAQRLEGLPLSAGALAQCLPRLQQPTPRVALGQGLRGLAHACLDISDGLLGDLAHICQRSGLSAQLRAATIPVADALAELDHVTALQLALAGGDDYELCFCAPAAARQAIVDLAAQCDVPVTRVGRMAAGDAVVVVLDAQGLPLPTSRKAYDHFR
ncbi:thiamine-phosphate kinase [Amantichitinum ursilacus]|uniref:Thiamine-monophosphate kinase n=1 Tax=Amantichitinum ursilacus TaxID=857265 RepID=A0A0N0XIM4_9NEIS|nr:thiamine-phosphate kinase [Amantichitinum ursilacus]KPC52890.1 Thiamine-monophosphate kinase [Amantichitinum ursilacus]